MLPNLLRITPRRTTKSDEEQDQQEDPEDVFASALGAIFTDDLRNQHGDPGCLITYLSRRLDRGVELGVADPRGEAERTKFAHYLWNAGVLMGELCGGRPGAEGEEAVGEAEAAEAAVDGGGGRRGGEGGRREKEKEKELAGVEWRLDGGEKEWWVDEGEEGCWRVEGERVLELGAGVGLAGIVSTLVGAEEVVISDYPAPEILENIEQNVKRNVPEKLRSKVSVQGHLWGDVDSAFAVANAGGFSRILAADCLWMPHEHRSLAKSMVHFLSPDPRARVFVIAGFHTGRAMMAPFFVTVVEEGLEIDDIYEMDAEARRREWASERDGGREDHGERNKWLVVARLKRKQ
ncbi:nicotinamide n-methyltransferase [Diplodia corticola]|uniref:Nicotinamide n-methyltransferase n=1 Tax=Diplodia corticola TaxID=236234 RepID=A0A1J9S726_9PEZI|nr:nicotinamide n-methyltransferase [Diplodia corticola]OJD36319.1 nicotinamide n-methyltransferase [Diplodia corticola]